jgi:lipopolysaccharide assembly outer membrane protein LptD (OstA)
MKATAVLLTLILVAPLWSAPPNDGFLVRAESVKVEGDRTIATGNATVTNGDTSIRADEIVFAPANATLTFTGHVTIQTGGATIEAREATINLHGKRVFMLSKGNIVVPGAEPFEANASSQHVRLFSTPFPKTETQLPQASPKP